MTSTRSPARGSLSGTSEPSSSSALASAAYQVQLDQGVKYLTRATSFPRLMGGNVCSSSLVSRAGVCTFNLLFQPADLRQLGVLPGQLTQPRPDRRGLEPRLDVVAVEFPFVSLLVGHEPLLERLMESGRFGAWRPKRAKRRQHQLRWLVEVVGEDGECEIRRPAPQVAPLEAVRRVVGDVGERAGITVPGFSSWPAAGGSVTDDVLDDYGHVTARHALAVEDALPAVELHARSSMKAAIPSISSPRSS